MPSWLFLRSHTARTSLSAMLALIVILWMAMIIYFPPYFNDFIGDDYVQLWRIREFLDRPETSYRIFNPFWTNWYFRPIQNIWFLINRLVFGLQPIGYYVLQISLHLIAISLTYHISRRIGLSFFAALITSSVFAIGGQHQLSIAWISSSGNVISLVASLGATAFLLKYLQGKKKPIYLLITSILLLLAVLSHESAVVIPPFLILVWWMWPVRSPESKYSFITIAIWVVILLGYVGIQISRPNANITIRSSLGDIIYQTINWQGILVYLSDIFTRAFALEKLSWRDFGESSQPRQLFMSLLLLVIIILISRWLFKRVNLATKYGAAWLSLLLGFVYVVLWIRRPELLDNRHLYSAWFGFSVIIGGGVQALTNQLSEPNKNTRNAQIIALIAILLLSIAGGTYYQFLQVKHEQTMILGLAQKVSRVETQMKQLLPMPSNQTKIYATRFTLSAPYMMPAATVWYNQPQIQGGTLSDLTNLTHVDADTYLFDDDDGTLTNLLPGLQDFAESQLLWVDLPDAVKWLYENRSTNIDPSSFSHDKIVGPPKQQRLALEVLAANTGWVALQYDLRPTEGSLLAVDYLGQAGQLFRIRILSDSLEEKVLSQDQIELVQSGKWEGLLLDMSPFADDFMILSLELHGGGNEGKAMPGYWSNPRLVTR